MKQTIEEVTNAKRSKSASKKPIDYLTDAYSNLKDLQGETLERRKQSIIKSLRVSVVETKNQKKQLPSLRKMLETSEVERRAMGKSLVRRKRRKDPNELWKTKPEDCAKVQLPEIPNSTV